MSKSLTIALFLCTLYSGVLPAATYIPGVRGEFYDGLWEATALYDLSTRTLVTDSHDAQINRVGDEEFPLPWAIGIRYSGFLKIDTPGSYTMHLKSADGSRLWINNAVIVDNDGWKGKNPAEKSGTVTLTAGYHALRIEYYCVYMTSKQLTLSWSGPGIAKEVVPASALYYDVAPAQASLTAALQALKNHLNGTSVLTAAQINTQAAIIAANGLYIGYTQALVTLAFEVADLYEQNPGPLFINTATKNGFKYTPGATDGFELARAILTVQQAIHDNIYSPTNLARYSSQLNGKRFLTADIFPGAVAPPANPLTTYTATINASVPVAWGKPAMNSTIPAVRPTGYYLAPGSIGTVTVPADLVNQGFVVRVGAHTKNKQPYTAVDKVVNRLHRVTKDYPITSTSTQIANPLGGGVYIIVPNLADKGILDVQLANVVPAPFFSATSFKKTTLQEWQDIQRKNPGAWADFVTDKFMMQVPRTWIYNYAGPVTLMQDWDKRMDAVSEFLGYPYVRNNYILYLAIDRSMNHDSYGTGYPQINWTYNPSNATNGNANHYYLKPGPDYWKIEFHEAGHAQMYSAFDGEGETVDLMNVPILSKKYGYDIDKALANSTAGTPRGGPVVTREQAALNWMVTENFRAGKPMDISFSEANEVRYQYRGWGKYVEIAALFGWDALSNFFGKESLDYMAQVSPADGLKKPDSRFLRMSQAAGVDLRPLIHFWGVQPSDANALKTAIASAGLKPSRKIYDRLVYYKSILPKNNAEFLAHAHLWFPAPLTTAQSPLYGEGWYFAWQNKYNDTHGTAGQNALQNIIDLYFPSGRPAADTAPIIVTQPQNRSVNAGQTATFSVTATAGSPISYQWRKNNGPISGANSATYTTPPTTAADNGAIFSVVVTAMGTVTSNPATLTVSNGALSSAKDLTTIIFPGFPPATISGTNISVTVPLGTDVTALAPTYTVSHLATGSPASGTTRDFTSPQTYTITAQDGSTKTYIVTVIVAKRTLSISNAPFATPNPANAGSVVQFTVAATGNDPLTYQWNLGDGSNAVGATLLHSYAAPGSYTVTVTVSDASGQSATESLTLIVVSGANPGDDTDGDGVPNGLDDDDDNDGVSDDNEIADGTDPLNPTSATKLPFEMLKMSGSVKFNATGKDSCSISGVLPDQSPGFNPQGVAVKIDIGGVIKSFTFDAKGRAKATDGSLGLKLKLVTNKATKKKEFLGGSVPFKVKISKGSWTDEWADEGVNPATSASKKPMPMVVDITFGGRIYTHTATVIYSSKATVGAKFKK